MKKIIFISSSGRSASTAIVGTLNTIKGVKAFQTPYGLENYNCDVYLKDLDRVKTERKNLIKSVHDEGYNFIESTVCIRFHFENIVKIYPECLIVHLVRDGRDFVRSGFNRNWFRKKKNRFNKICKHWSIGQRQMIEGMKKIPKKNRGGIVKLEDLIKGDINWFIESIGLESIEKIKMISSNATKTPFILPKWDKWDQKLVNASKIYMGKELEYFGYKW